MYLQLTGLRRDAVDVARSDICILAGAFQFKPVFNLHFPFKARRHCFNQETLLPKFLRGELPLCRISTQARRRAARRAKETDKDRNAQNEVRG